MTAQEALNIVYTQGKKDKKNVEYWHIKIGALRVGHVSISFCTHLTSIDIHINKKYRNMGIGTEALKHAVEVCKWGEITAIVRKSNKASYRIFQKNGFVIEMHNGPQFKMVYRKAINP